ncbi:MAG: glycoside hydrolase family 43 protein, partial [Sphingobacterium sp.]
MLSKLNLRVTAALLCSVFLILFSKANAQSSATIPGDFPDPSVIQANGAYFAVGTSSEWAPHLPIYYSKNMHDWVQTGFVFSITPEWAESSFWAPEYFYHEGLYYVYYSAKRKGDGVSCIGVATSRFPDRDFVDQGIVVDYGTESIDAYVVKEGDDLYMTWKAYGLDDRPIELLGSKMTKDGKSLVGEPFTLIKDTQGIGIEGQSFVKKDGYYYMFYSAGACCGPGCDYRVYASRSKSLKEPFTNVSETVLLGENQSWKCMGHGTFINGERDERYYLYHGYSKQGSVYTGREGLLAKLIWSDMGDPVFEFIENTNEANRNISLDFSQSKDQMWQWDFKNSKPNWKFTPTGARISGEIVPSNQTGIVLTWRPNAVQYSMTSTI